MSTKVSTARRAALGSARARGITVMVFLLLFSLFAFNRPRITTTMASGEHLKAAFSEDYKLAPYQSVVKLAGVQVGTVTSVERGDGGDGAVVDMKLEDGVLQKLGTEPHANIRPTLLLGGKYYVELVQGGQTGGPSASSVIPSSRTTVPVELDRVLSAVTPDAARSVHGIVGNLDKTFDDKGQRAVQRLLDDGPSTLGDTSEVLRAAQGNRPRTDLTHVVRGLQHAAAALNRENGQWAGILDDLSSTSTALADGARPLAATIHDAPRTLAVTRAGLSDLGGTLDRLETTAGSFRPSAQALAPLLTRLDPALRHARPVMADARVVARDARPLVANLVPVATDATQLLDDVSGPVLGRLNGPVKKAVLSPWHGTGLYEGGGNDHLLYKEVGYLLSDTADVFKFHDHNGAMGRLMAGIGLSTLGGVLGNSLEEHLEGGGLQLPAGPQEGANSGEPAPPLGSSPSSSTGSLLGGLALPLLGSN